MLFCKWFHKKTYRMYDGWYDWYDCEKCKNVFIKDYISGLRHLKINKAPKTAILEAHY